MANAAGSVIQIDEAQVRAHVDEVVRQSVEATLNGLLDAEADQLCRVKRYERSAELADTRAGSYERQLTTKAGQVTLKVPRLRSLPFETQIIERYRRRESSVEEALMEMYLAGVSVRRVEDITEALWVPRVSPSAVSELNRQLYERIETWRNQPIVGRFAHVYLDGIWLKRCWGGEVKNVAVLVAIGVDQEGYRQVLGVVEGAKEDTESWRQFLRHLKQRGPSGVELVISDKCLDLVETIAEFYPEAIGNAVWFTSFAMCSLSSPRGKAREVVAMLIRTNNPLERIMREIRRRTRVVGAFPDGQSALMLVAARLRHVAGTRWGTRKYLDMERPRDQNREENDPAVA